MKSLTTQIHFAVSIPYERIRSFCQKWKLSRLELFGSVLRNDFRPETSDVLPEIPWQQVKRMRNVLAHGYDGVDIRIVRDVIENHLPPLRAALSRVLSSGD